MPDLTAIAFRRWRLIVTLAVAAAAAAAVASLLSPKLYLATATALPTNSATADRARIFGANAEALYPELGTADELDKLEGTARLDTLYRAAVGQHNLVTAYGLNGAGPGAVDEATRRLKKRTEIRRTGYGELQVKVWDQDGTRSAAVANALMQNLNDLHRRAANANNEAVLAQLKSDYKRKNEELDSLRQQLAAVRSPDTATAFRTPLPTPRIVGGLPDRSEFLLSQLKTYERLIDEYGLAVGLHTNALAVVETARPAPYPDKPRTAQTVLLSFAVGLFFSFLLAVFLESRARTA